MFPSNRKKMWVAFLCVGDWTIRHGYGANRGTPVGKQFASGSSFDCRDSMTLLPSGDSGIVSPFATPWARSPTGPPPCQTPDRSMVPSGRCGAGPCGTAAPRPRPACKPPLPAGDVGAAGLFPPAVESGPGAGRCCAASAIALTVMAMIERLTERFCTGDLPEALLSLTLTAGRPCKHLLAVGEGDELGIGHLRSVLGHGPFHGNLVADLQGIPRPPLACQHVRAGQ